MSRLAPAPLAAPGIAVQPGPACCLSCLAAAAEAEEEEDGGSGAKKKRQPAKRAKKITEITQVGPSAASQACLLQAGAAVASYEWINSLGWNACSAVIAQPKGGRADTMQAWGRPPPLAPAMPYGDFRAAPCRLAALAQVEGGWTLHPPSLIYKWALCCSHCC